MIGYHLERKRGGRRLKLDIQDQEGGRILGVDEQGRWGVLKIGQSSWTSYVYHPLCSTLDQIEEQRKIKVDSKLNL